MPDGQGRHTRNSRRIAHRDRDLQRRLCLPDSFWLDKYDERRDLERGGLLLPSRWRIAAAFVIRHRAKTQLHAAELRPRARLQTAAPSPTTPKPAPQVLRQCFAAIRVMDRI